MLTVLKIKPKGDHLSWVDCRFDKRWITDLYDYETLYSVLYEDYELLDVWESQKCYYAIVKIQEIKK